MASEWRKTTVGDFCPFTYGKGLPERARNESGTFPVFGSNGVVGMHDSPYVEQPGIVIGRKGTVGAVHYSPNPFWPIDTTFYVTSTDDRDLRFTYYLLQSLPLDRMNADSAVPGLNRDAAHSVRISVPDIGEQRRIAPILGARDDKIELNQRMNRTLEQMAATIFKSWFIDFDPVHAKAEGRDPNLPPEIADLFPDAFEESEVGLIPKGWKVKPLSKTVQLLSGGTPKTAKQIYWNGGIPWFSVKDAPSNSDVWVVATERTITQAGLDNSAAQLLPERTTIISARGTVGRLALTGVPMAMNQSCYGIKGIDGYGDCFTYYIMRSSIGRLQRHTHGTVFDTITRKTFDTLQQVMPPGCLTLKFDKVTAPLLERMRSNLLQSMTLARLRDTLLPHLLRGRVSV